ncbi:hypothetical protein ES708_33180 [subsurface metagenome]
MKRTVDVTCPTCQKVVKGEVEVSEPPSLDDISNTFKKALEEKPGGLTAEEVAGLVKEQLALFKPPAEEAHRHRTFDELADCPECQAWVQKTGAKYQVSPFRKPETTPLLPAPRASLNNRSILISITYLWSSSISICR